MPPNRWGTGWHPHYTLSTDLVKDIIECRKSMVSKRLGRRGRATMVVKSLIPTGYVNCFRANKKGRNRKIEKPVTANVRVDCLVASLSTSDSMPGQWPGISHNQ